MIELKELTRRFTMGEETITAVDHVDLSIRRGDFVSIVGPSGSGKSTMMNILGLLDSADSGTYQLDGTDVTQLTEDQQAEIRNQKIGFVFQSFHLLPKLNALENIMVPLLYSGHSEKDSRQRAGELLARLGLKERAEHRPKQLSGGQQQRVAIARALAMEPELILADEPTGALDQATGREILGLLRDLNAGGQTIVLITHDEGIAQQADRILRMEDGHLTEQPHTAAQRPCPQPASTQRPCPQPASTRRSGLQPASTQRSGPQPASTQRPCPQPASTQGSGPQPAATQSSIGRPEDRAPRTPYVCPADTIPACGIRPANAGTPGEVIS